jgi:RNA polymerase sigma factor (sigma-70 family)
VVKRLVTENQRLVTYYAERHRGGAEWDDLIAAGKIGLVKAAERFDSGRGVPFASYAKFWIEKYFWKAVREHTRTMISQSLGPSLNTPIGEDAKGTLGDIFEDEKTPSPAEILHEKDCRELLKRAISIAGLNGREKTIINLRYPTDGEQPRKQKEIADELDLSPRRVRQIEASALGKIGSALSLGPESYLIPPEWESDT